MLIVEGAGGLLSPLTEEEYVADLAAEFGFPLIVVADNTLGTINRALSALVVAATYGEGLDVAGVILNEPRDVETDASAATNLAELRALRAAGASPGQMARQLADGNRLAKAGRRQIVAPN